MSHKLLHYSSSHYYTFPTAHVGRGQGDASTQVLLQKNEGKRPLGTPRHRRDDNIKVDLKEVGSEGVDWILLAQGPVAGCCEHDDEPLGYIAPTAEQL
jgi:hypothetical protein